MDLNLPLPPEGFKSPSQIARIATERWTGDNFYCPSCGTGLTPYRPGTRVYDFYSSRCHENFQLKASSHAFSSSVMDSEYHTMLRSIMNNAQPSLILLHYDRTRWTVQDLSVVHRSCITESCVIPRVPLSTRAERAGWQGCNISLGQVPQLGQIEVVSGGVIREKSSILEQWKRSNSLLQVAPSARGWLADVLTCVEKLGEKFTLAKVYEFENELARNHPNNRNIKPKIRQQLQLLRDQGLVEFVSPGVYRYLKK